MKIISAADLKIGDYVVSDSLSTVASGGHEGTVISIDDNFIYTETDEDVQRWHKDTLVHSEMSNYYLAWITEKTPEEYYL